MSQAHCGRCAEILPCHCLNLARAELVAIRRENARATATRLQEGRLLRCAVRDIVTREEEPLAIRALRARGSLR